jgi:hypothetical protein
MSKRMNWGRERLETRDIDRRWIAWLGKYLTP